MSDNIEERTYTLRWTFDEGQGGHAHIGVRIDSNYSPSYARRIQSRCGGHGYQYSASVYVAVLKMAFEILRHSPISSFSIEREGEQFPAMAPPCESFDGEKKYVVNWYNADHRLCSVSVTVTRNRNSSIYRYGTFAGGAASPMIALYEAACEVAGGAGTFFVTEAP